MKSLALVLCALVFVVNGDAVPVRTPVKEILQRRLLAARNNLRVAEGATAAPLKPDPELMAESEKLFALDQQGNAAKENTHWSVNTRSTNGKFFTKIDQSVFAKPTYKTFISLLDNYIPATGISEAVTPQEKSEETAFLDAILQTPVMKEAWDFLKKRGLASSTLDGFKAELQRYWFTVYRRKGAPDTSGFEHVFVGEVRGNAPTDNTDGFHNWIQLAKEEQAGRTEYQQWKGQNEPDLYGMQFKWQNHLKIKSTFAIGESPEMSMAINTVCFLVAPNNECKIRMGGAPASITSYRWDTRDSKEFYVASAYYN